MNHRFSNTRFLLPALWMILMALSLPSPAAWNGTALGKAALENTVPEFAALENTAPEIAARDTTGQERDSILMALNLAYLNGVNDHRSPYELIAILEQYLALDTSSYQHWFNHGLENIKVHEYEKALQSLNRGLRLYPARDNPTLLQIYISLSFCYNKMERYQMEKELLDQASKYFPDNPGILGRYVICAHCRVRYTEADHYRQKLILALRNEGKNESDIAFYIGRLYQTTDYLEAEKYFREAYKYDPDNLEKKGALAWVLIMNALKIDEGMALLEEVIREDPDNAVLIHQQGYGYFLKGRYEDAMANYTTAKELYQEYSYELENHIRMVREAMASLEKLKP